MFNINVLKCEYNLHCISIKISKLLEIAGDQFKKKNLQNSSKLTWYILINIFFSMNDNIQILDPATVTISE